MKKITNWRNATVADFEADNLLDDATKLHVMSYQLVNMNCPNSFHGTEQVERIKSYFQYHIENNIPIVMHSGISYDVPLAEKILGIDLSELMLIDSLALSWYLNPHRPKHGLDSFHEDYGIAKPKIDDWSSLSYEEYRHRCEEDVKINKALWEDLKSRLIDLYTVAQVEIDSGKVGGKRMFQDEEIYLDQFIGSSVDEAIDRLLTFLMFKMDCARLQEKTRWDVDVELLEASIKELTIEGEAAKKELESVMPRVAKYVDKKPPKKPFKGNGELSVTGLAWEEVKALYKAKTKDEYGNLLVRDCDKEGVPYKALKGYEEPNANSPEQIKAFLYSKGWIPQTFKYEKDEEAFNIWLASKPSRFKSDGRGSGWKTHNEWATWKAARPEERAIPQITVSGEEGKELCPSLEELAEEVPEIRVYSKYCVLKHRLGVLNGFKRDMKDNKLQARVNGFTNTLRMQHAEIVNLAGVDKAYGKVVRGVLVAGQGKKSLGSDLSSLEDRVKHHFMLPHDPEYVATMQQDDFDPHILMALTAKMITEKEYEDFKKGEKSNNAKAARKKGKTTNYASVYNAGAPKIAQAAGVSLEEGKILHEAYWKLNWSVKAIAEEQVVIKDSRGGKWLINPVNGFCYALRKESDRFSTLAQGTGAFFFDMWLDNCLEAIYAKWGKKALTGQMHDEHIFVVNDKPAVIEAFKALIQDAIEKVNSDFKLRRKLGCETQVGYRYSEIH